MIIHARICILCGLSPAQNRNIPPLRYDIVSRLVDVFPDMKFVLNGGVRTYDEIDRLLGYDGASGTYGSSQYTESDDRRELPIFDLQEKLSIPLSSARHHHPTSVFTALADSATILRGAEAKHLEQDCTSHHAEFSPAQEWSPVHGVMVGREAYNNPWAWADADRYYYGKQNPGYTRSEVLDTYLAYAESVLASDAPRSSIPYLCKPLHNFFTGCPGNKFYKRKLDNLLKVHVAHTEKASGAHVVDTEVSFAQIVREAVEGTIPLECLHSSACTFPPDPDRQRAVEER
jgi:tRNA-dihydrouridine synthase